MSAPSIQSRILPTPYMPLPIDPIRSPLPPVAQFLIEVASQRQSSLLGLGKAPGAAPAQLPTVTDPSAQPPTATSPSPPGGPLPTLADKASISPQAREQLAAGFDPRRGDVTGGSVPGTRSDGILRGTLPGLPRGAPAAAPPAGAAATMSAASAPSGTAWPASGVGAQLLRLVSALVAQVTAQAGASQRVVAA